MCSHAGVLALRVRDAGHLLPFPRTLGSAEVLVLEDRSCSPIESKHEGVRQCAGEMVSSDQRCQARQADRVNGRRRAARGLDWLGELSDQPTARLPRTQGRAAPRCRR